MSEAEAEAEAEAASEGEGVTVDAAIEEAPVAFSADVADTATAAAAADVVEEVDFTGHKEAPAAK